MVLFPDWPNGNYVSPKYALILLSLHSWSHHVGDKQMSLLEIIITFVVAIVKVILIKGNVFFFISFPSGFVARDDERCTFATLDPSRQHCKCVCE